MLASEGKLHFNQDRYSLGGLEEGEGCPAGSQCLVHCLGVNWLYKDATLHLQGSRNISKVKIGCKGRIERSDS